MTAQSPEDLGPRLDAHIEENSDGSLIIRLVRAVEFRGEKLHRLTLRRVKVRDVRIAEGKTKLEQAHVFADLLVQPEGAVAELESDWDYAVVQRAVGRQLGKYQEAGPPS